MIHGRGGNFPRIVVYFHTPSFQTPPQMDEMEPNITTAPPALSQALRRVLRPLVHLLLASGVTYPYLTRLLKEIFVEVANRDFQVEGKAQTDSRLSLLTGIHRKDIKRLRERQEACAETKQKMSLGAQIVSRWLGHRRYQTVEGQPLPLPRHFSEGGELSFEGLVAAVNKDIRSRAILDEWLRRGTATLDEEDRVCLNVEAFIPAEDYDEKAYFLGEAIHDHLAAAGHNLLREGPPFLDRSVYFDGLSRGSVAELQRLADRLGMKTLRSINSKANDLQAADSEGADNNRRIRFGIYFYSTEDTGAAGADAGERES